MLGSIFKSKEQREMERSMAIRRALNTHERHIKQLERHEREYMEKALRAKKTGDKQNLQVLCGMIAQTSNERRAIQSQLLHFQTLIQTRERMALYDDFRGAMEALSKSVGQMFKDFNAEELMRNVETTVAQSEQVKMAMDMVLDRIASTGMSTPEISDGVSAADIERLIGQQAVAEERSAGGQTNEIDGHLKDIERLLSGEK
jgi:hypothetical protein